MPLKATSVFGTVVVAAVLNALVAYLGAGDVVFNVGRAAIALVGGWFMVAAARRSLWLAAAVGPVVLIVDHVILKGGYFILAHYMWPDDVEGKGLLGAAGVLISFGMLLPIAVLCSWVSGLAARRKLQHDQVHP